MKKILYFTLLSLVSISTYAMEWPDLPNNDSYNQPSSPRSGVTMLLSDDFENSDLTATPLNSRLLNGIPVLESSNPNIVEAEEETEVEIIGAQEVDARPQKSARKRKTLEEDQPEKEQRKKYTCGFPGCTFKGRNSDLKHHILAMHISYKPYKCPGKNEDGTACTLATSQKSNLRAHIRACHKDQSDLQVPELSKDEKAQIETLIASYMSMGTSKDTVKPTEMESLGTTNAIQETFQLPPFIPAAAALPIMPIVASKDAVKLWKNEASLKLRCSACPYYFNSNKALNRHITISHPQLRIELTRAAARNLANKDQ